VLLVPCGTYGERGRERERGRKRERNGERERGGGAEEERERHMENAFS
jgi:hypothetical protein